MHIHVTQPNPNAQLDAAYAAQQAQARREAAAVRKKLMGFASKLATASDQDIWANWSEQGNAGRQFSQSEQKDKQQGETRQSGVVERISDWA
jgi:hypothetical protein